MRKTLLQTILAAFCAILCTHLCVGGGGMMIGARTAAWARIGVRIIPWISGGYYLATNGAFTTAVNYSYSAKVGVSAGDTIEFTRVSVGSGAYLVACYDANGGFVAAKSYGRGATINEGITERFVIPDGIAQIAMSSRNALFSGWGKDPGEVRIIT